MSNNKQRWSIIVVVRWQALPRVLLGTAANDDRVGILGHKFPLGQNHAPGKFLSSFWDNTVCNPCSGFDNHHRNVLRSKKPSGRASHIISTAPSLLMCLEYFLANVRYQLCEVAEILLLGNRGREVVVDSLEPEKGFDGSMVRTNVVHKSRPEIAFLSRVLDPFMNDWSTFHHLANREGFVLIPRWEVWEVVGKHELGTELFLSCATSITGRRNRLFTSRWRERIRAKHIRMWHKNGGVAQ